MQVQATADRGDNNVDNGISSPVSSTGTVTVSDGKLYSLTLSFNGFDARAILVNSVSGGVSSNGTAIPPDPDATYSLTVTAQATDRFGRPVLPGTQIRFGEIDSPLDAEVSSRSAATKAILKKAVSISQHSTAISEPPAAARVLATRCWSSESRSRARRTATPIWKALRRW